MIMGLFKPAWMSNNIDKAVKAVKEITDQAILIRVILEVQWERPRLEAISKITDETILADIAKKDAEDVGDAVIDKLVSQTVLTDVAKNSNNGTVRVRAVKKLTDLSLLADFVQNGKPQSVCDAANQRFMHLFSQGNDANKADPIKCSHQWEYYVMCLSKCKLCGAFCYKHNYECTKLDTWNYSSSSSHQCKNCGHRASAYENAYHPEQDSDTRQVSSFIRSKD
jgi:hypothetical protein